MADLTLLIAVAALAIWPIAQFFYSRRRYQEIIARLDRNDLDEVSTQDLVFEVLRHIGCQPQLNEEKQIGFKYQGCEFYITTSDENRLIVVWNPWWGSIDSNNKAFGHLKEIINAVNADALVTTVYTTDEDGKTVGLHSKCHVLFSPRETSLDEYLKALLDSFFTVHDTIKDYFNQLNSSSGEKEKARQTRVQVKGFASYRDHGAVIPIDEGKG